MQELQKIEQKLQQPETELHDAIEGYKEAGKLGAEILAYLDEVETTLQKIDPSKFLQKS